MARPVPGPGDRPGLVREIRQKNAGRRTHALVGVGAALFMLISKYGFTDVRSPGSSSWTPRGWPRKSSAEWDSSVRA
jgi:hypothetical protein